MTDLPHPRHDFILLFSEELDSHGLMRQPYDVLEEESHDDLVRAFTLTLPAPPEDPAETTPNEELELALAYADWLVERGELITTHILPPKAVAERLIDRLARS